MRLFNRKRANPYVIDPHKYEAQLLRDRDCGKTLRPTPNPPDAHYRPGEFEETKDNWRLLRAIYERVRQGL